MNEYAFLSWTAPAEGIDMHDWQDRRCAVCGQRGDLVRDHCHDTGLVRGLLCRSCNVCEGFSSPGFDWTGWRAGVNVARHLRHFEVYVNQHGFPGVKYAGALGYLYADEREAWWAEAKGSIESGVWPSDGGWTDTARARRDAEFKEMQATLAKVDWSGFFGARS